MKVSPVFAHHSARFLSQAVMILKYAQPLCLKALSGKRQSDGLQERKPRMLRMQPVTKDLKLISAVQSLYFTAFPKEERIPL